MRLTGAKQWVYLPADGLRVLSSMVTKTWIPHGCTLQLGCKQLVKNNGTPNSMRVPAVSETPGAERGGPKRAMEQRSNLLELGVIDKKKH